MIEIELASPEVVRHIVKSFGIRMKHKLGQNFLIRPDVVRRIAEAAELAPGTPVLEIGPGIGTLTQALARTGADVTALEIDRGLAPVLAKTLEPYDNVRILYQDFLKTDLPALFGDKEWHAAANLPYYITTPILLKLVQSDLPVSLLVFMMQKEVADRILAAPGTPDYGMLTIAVQFYATAERVMDIEPAAFIPRPAVTSTVLKMRRRKERAVSVRNEKTFFALVKMGFGQRRKTFSNAMKAGGIEKELIPKILETADIDGSRRGETFSMEEYARLADAWDDLKGNSE